MKINQICEILWRCAQFGECAFNVDVRPALRQSSIVHNLTRINMDLRFTSR